MIKIKHVKTLVFVLLLCFIATIPVGAQDFPDINNHWGKTIITRAAGDGAIKGYPDGTFKPDNTLTEAEFLTMLIRTFESIEPGNPWYKPFYDFANKKNYPVGSNPNSIILRARVAEVVAGTQGVNYSGNDAIQYLLGKGLAKGCDPNNITIANFLGSKALTRAEGIQFIYNLKDNGISELKDRPSSPSPINELPALPGAVNVGEVQDLGNSPRGQYVDANGYKIAVGVNPNNNSTEILRIVDANPDILSRERLRVVCTSHPEFNTCHQQMINGQWSNFDKNVWTNDYMLFRTGYTPNPKSGMTVTFDIYGGYNGDENYEGVKIATIQKTLP
ncbi:MAG: S-layer homology domain-containing protein [Lentimicrobiaceae bacterium]|nr:S-layer homology domain-containing protein [Lentimicrobiaceae bacterium]